MFTLTRVKIHSPTCDSPYSLLAQVLEIQESDNTLELIGERIHKWVDDKESLKACISPQKMWTPLHVPRPPFIGRRRDFYISIIPSDLENIPNGNMYINVFSYPVICGTNFGYLQTCHLSTLKSGLLVPRLWLGSFVTLPSPTRIDESSPPGFGGPNSTPKSSFPNCYVHPKLSFSWNNK
jgi:hypothetical protein